MADRLEVFHGSFFPDVAPLRHLRGLDLAFCPPLDQLVQLQQLCCLALRDGQSSSNLMRVVRYLSTRHQLTSFSISPEFTGYGSSIITALTHPILLAENRMMVRVSHFTEENEEEEESRIFCPAAIPWPRDTPAEVPPASLWHLRLDEVLSQAQFEAVCAMPRLERLECTPQDRVFEEPPSSVMVACLARLSHLALSLLPRSEPIAPDSPVHLTCAVILTNLEVCTNLRSFELNLNEHHSFGQNVLVNPGMSLKGLACLEELTFGDRVYFIKESTWEVVSSLTALRRMRTYGPIPGLNDFSSRLAALPQFVSLELTIWSPPGLDNYPQFVGTAITSSLFQSMAQSTTWRELHLRFAPSHAIWTMQEQPIVDAIVEAQLSPEMRNHLRIFFYAHGQRVPRIYRAGPHGWLLEP